MDRSLCHMEAKGDVDRKIMTRLLKRKFPILEDVSDHFLRLD